MKRKNSNSHGTVTTVASNNSQGANKIKNSSPVKKSINSNVTPNKSTKKLPISKREINLYEDPQNNQHNQINQSNENSANKNSPYMGRSPSMSSPGGSNLIHTPNSKHSHNLQFNSPTSTSIIQNTIQCYPTLLDASELLFNINDDHKTLIGKNTRLRTLLIQASGKLADVSAKLIEKEEEFSKEKSGILDELERITVNYRTYAEGYKNYSVLEDQHKNLQRDYQHNYNVLVSYGESMR